MSLRKIVAFSLTFVYLGEVALALASRIGEGRGDRSQELKPSMSPWNGTESAENLGPPDSHEAMNDREILSIPKNVREKRSFEFLMGLINNNSRFEVTRVDPENTTKKPAIVTVGSIEENEVTGEGAGASEILLELMVRIASHPDQWDRVHAILQTLDQDLKTSRSVVTQLQNLSHSNNTVKSIQSTVEDNQINLPTGSHKNITRYINDTVKTQKKLEQAKWPNFDEKDSNVKIADNNYTNTAIHDTKSQNNTEKAKVKSNKSAYPKNFTYHRVTGKPDSTSKNPRAYIAVSVIAPKSESHQDETGGSKEDLTLENELHQLKPWSHLQNLKDMESIRSKWIVQTNQQNKKS